MSDGEYLYAIFMKMNKEIKKEEAKEAVKAKAKPKGEEAPMKQQLFIVQDGSSPLSS